MKCKKMQFNLVSTRITVTTVSEKLAASILVYEWSSKSKLQWKMLCSVDKSDLGSK